MLSILTILTLLFLCVAQVIAVPPPWDGISPRPKPSSSPKVPKVTGHHVRAPGTPTGECDLNDHFILDRYTLRGTRWNITQAELKKAVSSRGAAVTSWKWDEDLVDGVQTFKARWNLPIGMEDKTEETFKKLVKPFKVKVNCRRHHDDAGPWHPKPDEYVPMEPEPKHEE